VGAGTEGWEKRDRKQAGEGNRGREGKKRKTEEENKKWGGY